jgi:hypothetical protein
MLVDLLTFPLDPFSTDFVDQRGGGPSQVDQVDVVGARTVFDGLGKVGEELRWQVAMRQDRDIDVAVLERLTARIRAK